PAALPLAALDHLARDVDSTKVQQALGLYDLQVARAHGTSLEQVFDVTEQFTDAGGCRDAVLRQMAADMRSRTCLHHGRSEEAGHWLKVALELRGRSFLPDGLVGDYLLYQQAAHHSITLLDHGVLEDRPGESPVHAEVDRLIEELAGRWCTRHQALCRIFLRNTRARRLEYLARYTLDGSLLPSAREDLLAESESWVPLIEEYAQHALRMGGTNLRRMHNQLIDLAVTEAALSDPRAYGTLDWRPPASAFVDELSEVVWTSTLRSPPADASPYDLVALFKWWWLRGDVDSNMLASGQEALGDAVGFPASQAAECLLRIGCGEARRNLEHSLAMDNASGSILSVLALRTTRILGGCLDTVPPPAEGTTLRRFFDALRSDEDHLVARCPY
ncbi:MAG: hypothetical protein MK085_14035, partial [Phycisphaerales bacterium]|nr:hypothetical protein [Phycisphaerales bacterium]